jgi:hypothetical protein
VARETAGPARIDIALSAPAPRRRREPGVGAHRERRRFPRRLRRPGQRLCPRPRAGRTRHLPPDPVALPHQGGVPHRAMRPLPERAPCLGRAPRPGGVPGPGMTPRPGRASCAARGRPAPDGPGRAVGSASSARCLAGRIAASPEGPTPRRGRALPGVPGALPRSPGVAVPSRPCASPLGCDRSFCCFRRPRRRPCPRSPSLRLSWQVGRPGRGRPRKARPPGTRRPRRLRPRSPLPPCLSASHLAARTGPRASGCSWPTTWPGRVLPAADPPATDRPPCRPPTGLRPWRDPPLEVAFPQHLVAPAQREQARRKQARRKQQARRQQAWRQRACRRSRAPAAAVPRGARHHLPHVWRRPPTRPPCWSQVRKRPLSRKRPRRHQARLNPARPRPIRLRPIGRESVAGDRGGGSCRGWHGASAASAGNRRRPRPRRSGERRRVPQAAGAARPFPRRPIPMAPSRNTPCGGNRTTGRASLAHVPRPRIRRLPGRVAGVAPELRRPAPPGRENPRPGAMRRRPHRPGPRLPEGLPGSPPRRLPGRHGWAVDGPAGHATGPGHQPGPGLPAAMPSRCRPYSPYSGALWLGHAGARWPPHAGAEGGYSRTVAATAARRAAGAAAGLPSSPVAAAASNRPGRRGARVRGRPCVPPYWPGRAVRLEMASAWLPSVSYAKVRVMQGAAVVAVRTARTGRSRRPKRPALATGSA